MAGRPSAVLIRDITRRKREEETARLQLQNFMRTDKLTSLGVLAAGLAHEISVPNQVILSNATLLSSASPQLAALLEAAAAGTEEHLIAGLDAAEFRDRLPEMLSAVVKSSSLIDGIIRNLRDFSADSPGRGAALFDVNTAIRNAVDLVGAYIRRATDRFTLELHPGLPRTRGKRAEARAGVHQSHPERLPVHRRQGQGDHRPQSARATPAPRCGSLISDEGAGIPAEILPRVREAFFTTREASGGTGLGLYVSQAIVTAHGGTLELTSTPGVGTDGDGDPSRGGEPMSAGRIPENPILLVDDEQPVIDSLSLMLRSNGIDNIVDVHRQP